MGSAATFYRGVQQQQNEHDLQMKDALRQQQLGQHDAVVKNIQGILASGVDPHTQQPLTDENKAQLNNALKITLDSQRNLYNPNFDPAKGEVPEDPIHRLTTKLHITADTHPAPGQQMQDLQDITAKYAAPVEVNPYLKESRQLTEAGLTPEQSKRAIGVKAGVYAKAGSGSDLAQFLDKAATELGLADRTQLSSQQTAEGTQRYRNLNKVTTKALNVKGKGLSWVSWDPSGKIINIIPGAFVRGATAVNRTSKTTDPFGVTSTTSGTTSPVLPVVDLTVGSVLGPEDIQGFSAAPSPEEAAAPTPANPPMSEVAPTGATPTGITPAGKPAVSTKTPAVQKKELSTIAGGNPAGSEYPPLDEDGHIPARAAVNPSLRQAANNILDGMDVEELNVPARDKAAAQDLAAKYGWKGQGTFTPKEQIMLREASTFIDKMAHSKSLATLDESFFKQLPMAVQSSDPAKEGLTVKILNKIGARSMTDAQAEFMQNYRQVVGTISGLSQLVRSGRATEATINRLIAELPNPYNTKNAQDAETRLLRIKQEISIAMQKGRFDDPDKASGDADIYYEVNDKNQLIPSVPKAPK